MTEKELLLITEIEKEQETQVSIEKSISSKQKKLNACKQKIIDLQLAVKEEQLESIREAIGKNGYDFNAFREALEKGLVQAPNSRINKNTNDSSSDKIKDEERGL